MVADFPVTVGTGAHPFVQDLVELEFLAMALDLPTFKAHLNILDDVDDLTLARLLDAAKAQAERILGYQLGDATELPNGVPADLEQGILMLGAHWYENREASLVGVTAQEVPFGAAQIFGEYRSYTYG